MPLPPKSCAYCRRGRPKTVREKDAVGGRARGGQALEFVLKGCAAFVGIKDRRGFLLHAISGLW